jgi:hypothetical protein
MDWIFNKWIIIFVCGVHGHGTVCWFGTREKHNWISSEWTRLELNLIWKHTSLCQIWKSEQVGTLLWIQKQLGTRTRFGPRLDVFRSVRLRPSVVAQVCQLEYWTRIQSYRQLFHMVCSSQILLISSLPFSVALLKLCCSFTKFTCLLYDTEYCSIHSRKNTTLTSQDKDIKPFRPNLHEKC